MDPHQLTMTQDLAIRSIEPKNIVIACGDGRVTIDLKTGSVTFTDCTPDEGAKAFWDAVERMAPCRGS